MLSVACHSLSRLKQIVSVAHRPGRKESSELAWRGAQAGGGEQLERDGVCSDSSGGRLLAHLPRRSDVHRHRTGAGAHPGASNHRHAAVSAGRTPAGTHSIPHRHSGSRSSASPTGADDVQTAEPGRPARIASDDSSCRVAWKVCPERGHSARRASSSLSAAGWPRCSRRVWSLG